MRRWLSAVMILVGIVSASCADELPCAELSGDECDSSRCAVISAPRVDTARMCLAAYEAVGCMEKNMICTSPRFLARDPSGGIWKFTHGCLPDEWQANSSLFEGQSYASQVPDAWDRPCP